MTNVKDAAVAWIAKHVRERWPGEQQPDEMAENLAGIAREYEVPVETLIEWIHLLPADEELSAEAFRMWAERYATERERVLAAVPREVL